MTQNLDSRAASDFSEAIRLDSTNASAFHNRALALNSKGDVKAALSDMLEALRIDPKFGGSDRFADGSDDAYVAGLYALGDATVTRNPQSVGGYALRASMAYHRGDDAAAIRDATEAIRIDSRDPGLLANRAKANLRTGNVEGALDDINEAILLRAKDPALYWIRGRVFQQSGDLPHALGDFDQAIKLDPKQQPALVYRGEVKEKMGQRDGAIADYTAALFLVEGDFYRTGLDAFLSAGQRLTALLREDKK